MKDRSEAAGFPAPELVQVDVPAVGPEKVFRAALRAGFAPDIAARIAGFTFDTPAAVRRYVLGPW